MESVASASRRASRILGDLPPEIRDRLLAEAVVERHPAGAVIVREGERGDAMYVVAEGVLQVLHEADGGEDLVMARLGPGESFGDTALVDPGGRRNATVRALTDATVRRIPHDALRRLLDDGMERRLSEVRDAQLVAAMAHRSALLRGLAGAPVRVTRRELAAGEVLVRRGDPPGPAFVVVRGRIAALDAEERVTWRAAEGSCVGERSVLDNQPRWATLVAETDASVLVVDADDLRALVRESPEWRDHVQALRRVYELPQRGFATQFTGVAGGSETLVTVYDLPGGRRAVFARVAGRELFTADVGGIEVAERVAWSGPGVRVELRLSATGALAGAQVEGAWPGQVALVRYLLEDRLLLPAQLEAFERGGVLEIRAEPDALACACLVVPESRVRAAIAEGADTVTALKERLGCGTVCGGCVPGLGALCGDGAWTPAKLTARVERAPGVYELRIEPADRRPAVAGQHVAVRARVQGYPVQRAYTLVRAEGDAYEIAVKREPRGLFSRWLTGVDLPAEIEVSAPQGDVVLRDDMRVVVALVAGIGVTPAVAMAREIAGRPLTTRLHVDLSGRDGFPFGDELLALARENDRITVRLRDTRAEGRLSSAEIGRLVAELPGAWFYLCGPGAFLVGVRRALLDAGVPDERLLVEVFTPTGGGSVDAVASSAGGAPDYPGWTPDSAIFAPPRRWQQGAGRLWQATLRANRLLWQSLGVFGEVDVDPKLPVVPLGAAKAFAWGLEALAIDGFATYGDAFVVVAPTPALVPDAPVAPAWPSVSDRPALPIHVVRAPDVVRAVMDDAERFDRGPMPFHFNQQALGAAHPGALPRGGRPAGLLVGEQHRNPTWQEDRTIALAALAPPMLEIAAAELPAVLEAPLAALEARPPAPFDAHRLTSRLALRMTLSVLFGPTAIDEVERAVWPIAGLARDITELVEDLVAGRAGAAEIRAKRAPAVQAIADLRDALSRARLTREERDRPLVKRVLACPDDEASLERLHTLVAPLLVAGHETTGTLMAWALYALGRDPALHRAVRDEIDAWRAARPGEPVGLLAQNHRPRTLTFLFELYRRYPPIAQTMRTALVDGEIPGPQGFRYARGSVMLVSIVGMHRNPGSWASPDAFDPDRFLAGVPAGASAEEQGRAARENERRWEDEGRLMPFVRGHGACVGRGLNQVEIFAFLDAVLSRFDLSLADPSRVVEPRGSTVSTPPPGSIVVSLRPRVSPAPRPRKKAMTAPVFIVSTGRCGSTLMSGLVNRHPDLLSVSEYFAALASHALRGDAVTGEELFERLNTPSPAAKALLTEGMRADEMLYEFGPDARYTRENLPPILITTLTHLTDQASAEKLWDELGPILRARPRAPLADQYRFLFEWLAERFGKRTWVERSGASLLLVPRLAELFPDARFVHVYRDGRSTALSMFNHDYFRLRAGGAAVLQRMGIDPTNEFNLVGVSPWMPTFETLWFAMIDPKRFVRDRDIPLEAFGRFWSGMIVRGLNSLAALPPERVHSLRYEDLVASPRETLEAFARFVGPDFADARWLDEASKIPNAGSVGWADLPQEKLDALTEACEPGNSLLGYTARRPVPEARDAAWALSRIRLLSHLDKKQLKRLLAGSTLETHTAGARLVTEGEAGDAMFLIESGHVQVFHDDGGEILVVRKLGPGDHFGEVALLRGGGRRTASVRAHSDVVLRRISHATLRAVLDEDDILEARLAGESDSLLAATVARRSELVRALDRAPLSMAHRDLRKGEILVRRGDPPGDAFVVVDGSLAILDETSHPPVVRWRTGPGSCVGERSILDEKPRSRTIVAEMDTRVLVVRGADLRTLVTSSPEWAAHVRALQSVYSLPKSGYVAQFTGEADGNETVSTVYHLADERRVMATRVVGKELFTVDDTGRPVAKQVAWTRGEERRELRLDAEGRVVGALVHGPWPALGALVRRVLEREALPPDVIARFPADGVIDAPASAAVTCSCLVVPEARVRQCIADGAGDVAAVQARLGCGSVCGGCLPRVAELLGEDAWTPATLAAREEIAPGVFRVEIRPDVRAPALAGQHVLVRGRVRGRPVQRSYTLTRAADPAVYEIGVRKEPGGVFSGWLASAPIGAPVEVSAPAGAVTLGDAMRSVVCLVAGIGVTPAVAIAREVADRGLATRVHVDLSARGAFPFGDELLRLRGDAVTVNLRSTSGGARLTSSDVEELVRQHPDAHWFVCGPTAYLNDVRAWLETAGVARDVVHVEVFTPQGDPPGTPDLESSSAAAPAPSAGWGPESDAFPPPRPPAVPWTERMGKALLAGVASAGRTSLGGVLWRALGAVDAKYDQRLPIDPTGVAGAVAERFAPHVLETFRQIGAQYPAVRGSDPYQPDGNTFVLIAPSPHAIADAPVPASPRLPKLGKTVAIHVLRGPATVRAVLEDPETFDREGYVHHFQQQGGGAEGKLPPGWEPGGLLFGPMANNETWRSDRQTVLSSVTSGWLDRGAANLPRALAPAVRGLAGRVGGAPFDAHVFTTRLAMRMNLAVLFGLARLDELEEAALPIWSLSRYARHFANDATRDRLPADRVREIRAPVRDALARMRAIVREAGEAVPQSPLVRSMVEAPDDEQSVQMLFPRLLTPLLAGQEAPGASLAWGLYVLAKRPDVRERVVREIDAWRAIHGDAPVGLVAQHERPVTLAFLFEVQRLYPPMQQTIRVAMRDGELPPDPVTGTGAFTFARGASFFVSISAINRCERWWKDPDRFDLERFMEGMDRGAPPAEQGRVIRDNARRWEEGGLYLPFGRGPGTCIGRGLSQVEWFAFLDTVLSRFELDLADPGLEIDQIDVGPPTGTLAMRVRERARVGSTADPVGAA